ncbi:putative repeat protein (TIGR03837 family) [Oxalobacteraceae bacterium GrIS 2.11]
MATTLALFCKVVDNFGDIGICYRLARQLVAEHQLAVTLYVDDLASFKRLCPNVVTDCDWQQIDGIFVVHWRNQDEVYSVKDVADIVVEFFGCELPPSYISAMQQRQPVWINLEGLSAEDWVEGCHMVASPQNGQTKYFFYPGFTDKTGGLILEAGLLLERDQFQHNPFSTTEFLEKMGLTPTEMSTIKVSLFCYLHAPVLALFHAWQINGSMVTCLVPEGVAREQIEVFLARPAVAGASATRGKLTVRVIPFLAQSEYDKLLWSCDINFVRGEDSFVRAQWAGRPFVWHIYPQDKDLHHVKLKAFLDRTLVNTPSLTSLSLAWNEATSPQYDWGKGWQNLERDLSKLGNLTPEWQYKLLTNGDLATNLLKFAVSIAQKARETKL